MNQKLLLSYLALSFWGFTAAAWGADIEGKVAAVEGDQIRVSYQSTLRPKTGDAVKIFWDLGGDRLPVGNATVTEVGSRYVLARISDGAPNIDMIAVISASGGTGPTRAQAPPAQPPAPTPPPAKQPGPPKATTSARRPAVSQVPQVPVDGVVSSVQGNRARISFNAPQRPKTGDAVSFVWHSGGDKIPTGFGTVAEVGAGYVVANITRGSAKSQNGAVIYSTGGSAPGGATTPPPPVASRPPPPKPSQPTLAYREVREYTLIWTDKGSGANKDFAAFRPRAQAGYFPVGDVAATGPWKGPRYGSPPFASVLVSAGAMQLKPPADYRRVWNTEGSNPDQPFSVWEPIAPSGYRCVGDVGNRSLNEPPSRDAIRCVPQQCTEVAGYFDKIWDDSGSGARTDFSVWRTPNANVFMGFPSHGKPNRPVYQLKESCFLN